METRESGKLVRFKLSQQVTSLQGFVLIKNVAVIHGTSKEETPYKFWQLIELGNWRLSQQSQWIFYSYCTQKDDNFVQRRAASATCKCCMEKGSRLPHWTWLRFRLVWGRMKPRIPCFTQRRNKGLPTHICRGRWGGLKHAAHVVIWGGKGGTRHAPRVCLIEEFVL